jgi:hypothetical protein
VIVAASVLTFGIAVVAAHKARVKASRAGVHPPECATSFWKGDAP